MSADQQRRGQQRTEVHGLLPPPPAAAAAAAASTSWAACSPVPLAAAAAAPAGFLGTPARTYEAHGGQRAAEILRVRSLGG